MHYNSHVEHRPTKKTKRSQARAFNVFGSERIVFIAATQFFNGRSEWEPLRVVVPETAAVAVRAEIAAGCAPREQVVEGRA